MEASQPIDRIVLKDTRHEDLNVELVARIDEQGNLVLEGWDRGEFVKQRMDDWDYEYWLKISREWKDTILLHLIRERFENDSRFMEWLKEKNIPYEFSSYT
jgi:hypothetical protein